MLGFKSLSSSTTGSTFTIQWISVCRWSRFRIRVGSIYFYCELLFLLTTARVFWPFNLHSDTESYKINTTSNAMQTVKSLLVYCTVELSCCIDKGNSRMDFWKLVSSNENYLRTVIHDNCNLQGQISYLVFRSTLVSIRTIIIRWGSKVSWGQQRSKSGNILNTIILHTCHVGNESISRLALWLSISCW